MDARTVSYLQTRFTDYYRHADLPVINDIDHREFAVIPWQTEPSPPMFRHMSVIDYESSLTEFLTTHEPRHAYYSAARYDAPTADDMSDKGWKGADLIFDLDADHLEDVDATTDSYETRLEKCKDELYLLLDILEDDFGYTDPSIVFSGGRGYHVHVKTNEVQSIGRNGRSDIADYVSGYELQLEDVVHASGNDVSSQSRSAKKSQQLNSEGGWGRWLQKYLIQKSEYLAEKDKKTAINEIAQRDNFGEMKAEKVYNVLVKQSETLREGDIVATTAFKEYIRRVIDECVSEYGAAIDEQVTKDVRRLIRIPGSLHGRTGLKVMNLSRSELDSFSPLDDAVPETFASGEIEVSVTESCSVSMNGQSYDFVKGTTEHVTECVAIYLMSNGKAKKY